jgi:hypothetical protein
MRWARIVEACSDSLDPKDTRSWRERKAGYLTHLAEITDEATLGVALADKVHNARSIVRDYRAEGHALWDRFTNMTIDDQLWYYRALVKVFSECRPCPLVERTCAARSTSSTISPSKTPRPPALAPLGCRRSESGSPAGGGLLAHRLQRLARGRRPPIGCRLPSGLRQPLSFATRSPPRGRTPEKARKLRTSC